MALGWRFFVGVGVCVCMRARAFFVLPFPGEGITLLIYFFESFLKCDITRATYPQHRFTQHIPLLCFLYMVNSHCILAMHIQNKLIHMSLYACLDNLSIFPLQQVLIKFNCKFSSPIMFRYHIGLLKQIWKL